MTKIRTKDLLMRLLPSASFIRGTLSMFRYKPYIAPFNCSWNLPFCTSTMLQSEYLNPIFLLLLLQSDSSHNTPPQKSVIIVLKESTMQVSVNWKQKKCTIAVKWAALNTSLTWTRIEELRLYLEKLPVSDGKTAYTTDEKSSKLIRLFINKGRKPDKSSLRGKNGGDNGTRTHDLSDANRTLYQLSYIPMHCIY